MSDASEDPDASTPPPRADTLREVDWPSVAPWLELLDTPRRTLGYGLVIGAVGAVLLGGVPTAPPAEIAAGWRSAWEGVASFPAAVGAAITPAGASDRGWPGYALGIARLVAWAFLGLVIADRAALGVGDGREESLLRSAARSARRFPRLAALLLVGFTPTAFLLLVALPWVTSASLAGPLGAAMAVAWFVVLAGALATAVLAAGVVVGAPLLGAAIVVDDSDAFDAASRMYAYVYQRPARLAFYLAVLAACGVAAGSLVEALAGATLAVARLGVPADLAEAPAAIVAWWEGVFVRALRGFYPAYFFTAAVTLYLQLRRDIDGQPTDEAA